MIEAPRLDIADQFIGDKRDNFIEKALWLDLEAGYRLQRVGKIVETSLKNSFQKMFNYVSGGVSCEARLTGFLTSLKSRTFRLSRGSTFPNGKFEVSQFFYLISGISL